MATNTGSWSRYMDVTWTKRMGTGDGFFSGARTPLGFWEINKTPKAANDSGVKSEDLVYVPKQFRYSDVGPEVRP